MKWSSQQAIPLVMKSHQFRREREPAWRRLETLVTRAEDVGTMRLDAQDLLELPLLYRIALSSLSVARSISLDRHLVLYLENLSSRAYLCVYGPRSRFGQAFGDFIRWRFPEAVRELRLHILIAAAAFVVGILSGYLLVRGELAWFSALVPSELAAGRDLRRTAAELRSGLFSGAGDLLDLLDFAANRLFQNNAVIGIFCFALGFLAGVPPLLLIGWQGAVLGALLARYAAEDLTVEFIGWISIHGVTEMAAIILLSAGGLRLGELVVFPGDYTRQENLARHAPTAALVAVGGMGMFVIAAVVESFLRQAITSTGWRWAIAALSLAGWSIYFLRSRRGVR